MRRNIYSAGISLIILISGMLCVNDVKAQKPKEAEATKTKGFSIASLRLIDLSAPSHYMRVILSTKQDAAFTDLAPGNFTIKFLPSGKTVPSSAIDFSPGQTLFIPGFGRTWIQIVLNDVDVARPNPGDDRVELTFNALHFVKTKADGSTEQEAKNSVVGVGKIYNTANIASLTEDTEAELKKTAAHAKTSDEKDIFAGLNITVPSGGGSTEGSGDISINRTLYSADIGRPSLFDKINFGLNLKKGSENRADPRHFDIGFNFRKTFLLIDRNKLNNIRSAINGVAPSSLTGAGAATASLDQVQQDIDSLGRDFFRAVLYDNALRFEGDVKGFSVGNVSNLVYDTQLQIATVSQGFAGYTGFFNLRIIPVGFEGGYNLTNDDNPDQEKRSLARVKAGAVINLHYQSNNPADFLNRIEFEAKGVNRYLFTRESAFDEATKKAIFTDKGNKYWVQADLKFSFGSTFGNRRVGLRASFTRGSLPPVYAFTKAFNFGIVLESPDDDSSKDIKLK